MKITGIPIADMNAASTRIRFFRFLEHLPSEFNSSPYCGDLNCDVLYLQKNSRDRIMEIAGLAKRQNIPIVYDIDDDFNVWPGMHEIDMMNLASAVTTDTEARASYLRNYTKTPVYVIPDALDYVQDNESKIEIPESIKKVVTFGNIVNIQCTADHFNAIPQTYTKTYIGPHYQGISGTNILWQLSTFLQNLKANDVAILVHPQDNQGYMKSNNRLLVCMSIGLPTIVSNTQAYSFTLKQIGYESLIAQSSSDVPNILKFIESQNIREDISIKFHKYAWENFSPKISSDLLSEIFKKVKVKI